MFEDYDKTLLMVRGAYKKLKSYYFYDKTLLHIKYKIAEFEYNRDEFEKTLEEISSNLVNQDSAYFQSILSELGFKVLPKKMKSCKNSTDVVKSVVDHKKDLEKINFFIDAPIQIFILDFLWTLLIGKIATDNKLNTNFSYASRFKKSIFNSRVSDLFNGIDFFSNRCFEPYFGLYSKWRDGAFNKVKATQNENDVVIISLDLKSFYYTVEFNFDTMPDLLNNDIRLDDFGFLTSIIKNTYIQYTDLICDYKKGVKKQNDACVFPIGLISPLILRELYLKKLDNMINSKIAPLYYGRYVDDILIVTNAKGRSNFSSTDFTEKFLISSNLASPSGNDDLKFNEYPNLRIQKDKVNFLFFEKSTNGNDNILLDIYDKQIRVNSSEANLLPDIELLSESFNNSAYIITNLDKSNKIRDLGFMESNNYKAMIFINGLTRLLKNTNFTKNEIAKYLDEIIEFYRGSQSIEYLNSWRSIFELFILGKEKDKANNFFLEIKNYIKNLTFDNLNNDEVVKKKQSHILKRLKADLLERLYISLALAMALDFNMIKGEKRKLLPMAEIIRNTNFLNHHLVSFPLLNYSIHTDVGQATLLNSDISTYATYTGNFSATFKLDDFKLDWSPRYINLNEFYLCYSLFFFCNKEILADIANTSSIFKKYIKYNNLVGNFNYPVLIDELNSIENSGINVLLRKTIVSSKSEKSIKVGLVNTNLNEQLCFDCLDNPSFGLTLRNKKRLFQILNIARAEKTRMLVFPEFYLPISWLNDIAKYATDNNIAIISGLQYIKQGNRAFNVISVINTATSVTGFRNSIVFLREKNYYAPSEKIELSKRGYLCNDSLQPFYYLVGNKNVTFSTILCFEFTDIISRASLKSQIDILFVPQFNKDTNYFASIVESTARDLHCFIVQANTSVYGDSRITAPYKTDYKNLVQIKGGINDLVIVGELNINELREFQKRYTPELDKAITSCFKCKKLHNKNLKQQSTICEKCSNALSKSHIKNNPPNFNRW